MARRIHTSAQIIHKLREVEVLLAQGQSVQQASRQIGVTEQTYYRWRKEYGGLRGESGETIKSFRAREYPPEAPGCRERA